MSKLAHSHQPTMDKIEADRFQEEHGKIVTSHVCPPIPIRSCDWCAHLDGEEERGGYGYGATEAEAIRDFIENYEE